MISKAQAEDFAKDWIDAWNSHDLERILSHYTEDFEMSSPKIMQYMGEQSGMLKGKAAIGEYWAGAFRRIPNLHFELKQVLIGANSIVIYYSNQDGKSVAEVIHLNLQGKGVSAAAHYS